MKPQDEARLLKMYTFAEDVTAISEEVTLDRLTSDKAFQYSLLYPLGQIGEIAINMSNDVLETYPSIEWSKWRGFRNRLFHKYDDIDFSIVLEMITEALPLLLTELQGICGDDSKTMNIL